MGNFSARFSRPGGGGGPKSKNKDKSKHKKDKGKGKHATQRASGESATSGANAVAAGAAAAGAGEDAANRPMVEAEAREERALAVLRQQLMARPRDLVLDQLLLLMPLDVNWETLQSLAARVTAAGAGAGASGDSAETAETVSGARLGAEARAKLHAQERRALSPDALAHVAALAVAFRTRHGPDKGALAALLPTRLFLVQENVAVDEYAGAGEDPRPYTRLPGGGIRYVLRTESGHSVGRVRLYATAASVAAAAARASASTSTSDSSGSPRRSTDGDLDERHEEGDEEEEEEGGAAAERPADSGHESHDSARTSEDRGDASGQGPAPHDAEGDGDTRSPKDPLPPVPFPFAAGTGPAPRRILTFGPQHPEPEWGGLGAQTGRRPSGVLPFAGRGNLRGPVRGQLRGRGRGALHAQQTSLPATPPSASATTSAYSTPSTSRASEDTDYGYGGSQGSGRVALGVGGHWPRPSVKYTPLRDGEIPFACFLAKDIPRSQVVDSDDEDAGVGAGGGAGGARGRGAGALYATRRYLRPKAYALALGPPPGMETPISCRVRVALPQAAWPAAAEFKWLHRSRAVGTDQRTQKPIQWPAPADVDKVRTLGCLLVPVEKNDSLEWEYAFPHAEAYLESRLSGLQVRVLLAAAALLRACAGRAALEEGEWAQWLRHALFWQCERDVLGWAEERPGRALAALLEAFYTALTRRRLACYFMPKLNLLADARTGHVRRIQERLFRVRESLLVHSLSMTRSLKALGAGASAPSTLDVHVLHNLLVTDDFLAVLNPALSAAMATSQPNDGSGGGGAEGVDDIPSSHSEEEDDDVEDRDLQWRRKAWRQVEAERAATRITEARRASVDSIDLQAAVARAPWDGVRRRLVLEQLANALWARARWAQARGWLRHARVCARQASRLARLLEETDGAQRAEAASLREAALAVEAACDQARRDARRRQIELRKTSRVRGQLSPSALEPGSPVVLVGDVAAAAANSATFAFPSAAHAGVALDDAAAGESGDLATAAARTDDEAEDDAAAENRRYSTIAEVHAEMAAMRLAEEDEDDEAEAAEESSTVVRALVHPPTQGATPSAEGAALGQPGSASARTSTSSDKGSRASLASKDESRASVVSTAGTRSSVSSKHDMRASVSSNEARSSVSSNEARSSVSSNNPRGSAVSTNDSRSSNASNDTRASAVSNNMRSSIASNVTYASVASSSMRTSMMQSDTRASVTSNNLGASIVNTDARASVVSNAARASVVSNDSRASTVSNDARASVVSNDSRASVVSNDARASVVSNNSRASVVSNDSRASIVSVINTRASIVSNDPRASTVSNNTRVSTVNNIHSSNSNDSNDARSSIISHNARTSTVSNDSRASVSSNDTRSSVSSSDIRSSILNGIRASVNNAPTAPPLATATKPLNAVQTLAEEDEDEDDDDMDLRL